MKKNTVTVLMSAVALLSLALLSTGAELTTQNKQFLAAYDIVHQALVADDLVNAKKAATNLGISAAGIATSKTLEEARLEFSKVSVEAEKLAAGQSGYYIMHCPMKKTDWVQTSTKVENPYGGKEMLSCGEVKK